MITLRVGKGRPKGCENPKQETTITRSYYEEYWKRNNELDLETEKQMRKRLFK